MAEQFEGLIPITQFRNVNHTTTEDTYLVPWLDLVELFREESSKVITSKESATLFSSCDFDGSRRAANAVESSMLVLDIDDGADIDKAHDIFFDAAIAGFIYTTASHKSDHHKFRICVPLTRAVTPQEYTKAWFGLNALFGDIADPSKKTCESMFYVPGHLIDSQYEFTSFEGTVHSAEEWMELAPIEQLQEHETASKAQTKAQPKRKKKSWRRFPALQPDDLTGVDIYRNPIVPKKAIQKYLNRSENWHHARYGFMCSVAAMAAQYEYPLSASELKDIFNELDREDGSHYTSSDYQKAILVEAQKVIQETVI